MRHITELIHPGLTQGRLSAKPQRPGGGITPKLRISDFGLRISFGFRISGFGFLWDFGSRILTNLDGHHCVIQQLKLGVPHMHLQLD